MTIEQALKEYTEKHKEEWTCYGCSSCSICPFYGACLLAIAMTRVNMITITEEVYIGESAVKFCLPNHEE